MNEFVIKNGFISKGDGTVNNDLTVNGNTIISGTLYSNTISASTYQNLPIDPNYYITGGTLNSNAIEINRNDALNILTISGSSSIIITEPISGLFSIQSTGGASNLGGGIGLFAQKSGVDLQFKSLTSTGDTITISGDSTTVNIEVKNQVNDANKIFSWYMNVT